MVLKTSLVMQIRTYVDMFVFIYIVRLSILSRNPPVGRIFGPLLGGCSHKIVCFDDICCKFLNSAPFNPRPPDLHMMYTESEREAKILSVRDYQMQSN